MESARTAASAGGEAEASGGSSSWIAAKTLARSSARILAKTPRASSADDTMEVSDSIEGTSIGRASAMPHRSGGRRRGGRRSARGQLPPALLFIRDVALIIACVAR
eukprot:scaffold28051_cov100-Isochrysis_galbana.AAC.2